MFPSAWENQIFYFLFQKAARSSRILVPASSELASKVRCWWISNKAAGYIVSIKIEILKKLVVLILKSSFVLINRKIAKFSSANLEVYRNFPWLIWYFSCFVELIFQINPWTIALIQSGQFSKITNIQYQNFRDILFKKGCNSEAADDRVFLYCTPFPFPRNMDLWIWFSWNLCVYSSSL